MESSFWPSAWPGVGGGLVLAGAASPTPSSPFLPVSLSLTPFGNRASF